MSGDHAKVSNNDLRIRKRKEAGVSVAEHKSLTITSTLVLAIVYRSEGYWLAKIKMQEMFHIDKYVTKM